MKVNRKVPVTHPCKKHKWMNVSMVRKVMHKQWLKPSRWDDYEICIRCGEMRKPL